MLCHWNMFLGGVLRGHSHSILILSFAFRIVRQATVHTAIARYFTKAHDIECSGTGTVTHGLGDCPIETKHVQNVENGCKKQAHIQIKWKSGVYESVSRKRAAFELAIGSPRNPSVSNHLPSFFKLPSSDGMVPVSVPPDSTICSKSPQLPSSVGMVPVTNVVRIQKFSNSASRPTDVGMGPVKPRPSNTKFSVHEQQHTRQIRHWVRDK